MSEGRKFTAGEHGAIERYLGKLAKLRADWMVISPEAKRIDDAARSLTELLYGLISEDICEADGQALYARIGKALDGFRQ